MPQSGTILYVSDPLVDDGGSLFGTLSTIGSRYCLPILPMRPSIIAKKPSVCAAVLSKDVIQISVSEDRCSVAEKLKLVNPDIRVVLGNDELENCHLRLWVDARYFFQ